VTYQPVGPENRASARSLQADDIFYFVRVALFIWVLCAGYVVSQPSSQKQALLLRDTAEASPPDADWSNLPLWQRKASEKAAARYAETQEKKWRRWNDAMFERPD
jgi:hypothetical protein